MLLPAAAHVTEAVTFGTRQRWVLVQQNSLPQQYAITVKKDVNQTCIHSFWDAVPPDALPKCMLVSCSAWRTSGRPA